MSELKAYTAQEIARNEKDIDYMDELFGGVKMPPTQVYLKSEADKVIAERKEKYNELAKLHDKAIQACCDADKVIAELKNGIAPNQSDKTLQERVNEICEKHGVSTLQDLDWAFCESEKRRTSDCIEAAEEIRRQKYKRCLANAWWCRNLSKTYAWSAYNHRGWKIDRYYDEKAELYRKWRKRWLELAEKFKPNNSTAQQGKG